MGSRLSTPWCVRAVVAPAVFFSVSLLPSVGDARAQAGAHVRATPFLTEEAPLRPLAAAFGFRMSGSRRTGRVRIYSHEHEIVIAPGMARALIDGKGVPLLTAPRFMRGEIVVPAELADIIRRMGASGSSTDVPAGSRAAPRKRSKIAFLPATTDHTMLLAAGGASGGSGGTGERRGVGAAKVTRPVNPVKSGRTGALKARPDTGKHESAGDAGLAEPPREARGLVLIDAGHGGRDEGARGPNGTKEKDVVLLVAKALGEELGREGVRVEYTRANDTFVPLRSRAVAANRLKPDLFLSLHANSYPERDVHGIETWAAARRSAASRRVAKDSRALAKRVQAALVRATGERDRGVRTGNLAVLRRTKLPAVLVELGFLSHPETEEKLTRAAYRAKLAKAVAGAILDSGLLTRRQVTCD